MKMIEEAISTYLKQGRQLKLVMVDDDALLLQLYAAALQHEDYKVLQSTDSLFAVDLIKTLQDLAVVVSDYNMLNMDGERFLSEVRRLHPCAERILVSADHDLMPNLEDPSVPHAYIKKPFKNIAVRMAIREGIDNYLFRLEEFQR